MHTEIRIPKDPKLFFIILLFGFAVMASSAGLCLLLGLSTGRIHIQTDCKERADNIPDHPTYPNSTLSANSPEISDQGIELFYRYIYETDDSAEAVKAFYEEVGISGNADPFGQYHINIYDGLHGGAIIHADVFWERCSSP